MKTNTFFYFFLASFTLFLWSCDAYKKGIQTHRQVYQEAFVKNPQAPLDSEGIKKMQFFKINKTYLLNAEFESTPNEKPFEMATFDGKNQTYIKYGLLKFVLNKQPFRLAIYQNLRTRNMPMFREKLFLPFKDITNGNQTYGGGRYLDISTRDIQQGKLILDFNKAYNPYCAYTDGYSCPIPPQENHLDIEILAGEKNYQ